MSSIVQILLLWTFESKVSVIHAGELTAILQKPSQLFAIMEQLYQNQDQNSWYIFLLRTRYGHLQEYYKNPEYIFNWFP